MTTAVERFGQALGQVIDRTDPMPLGPASPDPEAASMLRGLTVEAAFEGLRLVDRAMAEACLAGLWLRANDLDASHRVSQGVDNPTGSYWHAIMHRREPDYSNARYWFAKVGDHPVYAPLHERAAALAAEAGPPGPAAFLVEQPAWNPSAFNDFVEEVIGRGGDAERLALAVQDAEWWLLFEHSFDRATAPGRG